VSVIDFYILHTKVLSILLQLNYLFK